MQVLNCFAQEMDFGGMHIDIGKKQALKKYDQFALNTSCFLGICAISRNFCLKNNLFIYLLLLLKQKFREISQNSGVIFFL